jgi:hypothetical protein
MTSVRNAKNSATEFVPTASEKPIGPVLECLIVTFYVQVPGGQAIESSGIESKLAPSF